jgi:hypothetical protein
MSAGGVAEMNESWRIAVKGSTRTVAATINKRDAAVKLLEHIQQLFVGSSLLPHEDIVRICDQKETVLDAMAIIGLDREYLAMVQRGDI